MGAYGAGSAKRQYAYANSPHIRRVDKGKLKRWAIPDEKKVTTAVHYYDKEGNKRWHGTAQLKSTEKLA